MACNFNGQTPIVCDIGSATFYAGFGGDTIPFMQFPNVVGTRIYTKRMLALNSKTMYVGNEAIQKCGILKMSHPVEHGRILNKIFFFKIMEDLLFNQLRISNMEEQPILITEHPQNPRENREKMTEILFERFQFAAVHFNHPANFIAPKITNGILIDCGHGVTTVSPIKNGNVLENDVIRQDFGGNDVFESIINHLNSEGASLFSSGTRESIFQHLNPSIHRVVLSRDFRDNCSSYLKPDGNKVSFGFDTFYAPDILFNPRLIHANEFVGIHEMIKKSIYNYDIEDKTLLLKNIHLSGSSTLFLNFPQILEHEISSLFPNLKINIHAEPNRRYNTWIHASEASMSPHTKWISNEQFQEIGINCLWI